MNTSLRNALMVGLALLLPVMTQANVGKVLYTTGTVSVEREQVITLSKGDMLEQGDIIITGTRARAQLLMIDGARVSIRSNSRFEIETYKLDGARASAIATGRAEGEISLNLLKGGLRTITGAIGKTDQSDYSLRTPVATLGIRGTDYHVQHCAGDCNPPPWKRWRGTPGRTYTGVNSGGDRSYLVHKAGGIDNHVPAVTLEALFRRIRLYHQFPTLVI